MAASQQTASRAASRRTASRRAASRRASRWTASRRVLAPQASTTYMYVNIGGLHPGKMHALGLHPGNALGLHPGKMKMEEFQSLPLVARRARGRLEACARAMRSTCPCRCDRLGSLGRSYQYDHHCHFVGNGLHSGNVERRSELGEMRRRVRSNRAVPFVRAEVRVTPQLAPVIKISYSSTPASTRPGSTAATGP